MSPGAPRFLLSEALRGEGAQLLNADGERFMTRYEAAGELASRDLVSRAIVREQRANRRPGVPVDAASRSGLGAGRGSRPSPAAVPPRASISRADRIPVGPAAHYVMGGVETDLWGRTTVPGLYAAGEVACTGVHGANRLASNSLLEGLVFGARAAQAMLAAARGRRLAEPLGTLRSSTGRGSPTVPLPSEADVRGLMWNSVGLWREDGACCGRPSRRSMNGDAALGDDRSRIAAARHRRPADGASRLAPRGIARRPRPRRLSGQR